MATILGRMLLANRKLGCRAWVGDLIAVVAMVALIQGHAAIAGAANGSGSEPNGEQLYKQVCARCHSNGKVVRAPQLTVLRTMDSHQGLDALELGGMKFVGFKRTAR